MKSLLAKIMLAQIALVFLALIVVMIISRVSLQRGFENYLEQWESAQLASLVPELEDLYRERGGWQLLRNNPRAWERLLRLTRPIPPGQTPQPGARPPLSRDEPTARGGQGLRSLERMRLAERLYLLDAERKPVAGRLGARKSVGNNQQKASRALQPIEVEGEIVGWAGFSPVGRILPPEAHRFLVGQQRVLVTSLLIGLLLAAALGFLLARHLSRPVTALAATLRQLSAGDFDARAAVTTADEIGVLAGQVNELAATLERNRSARRRWMADIAHELRTPVAVMKGEIEALEDGIRQPDARSAASLREEVDQLSSLIEDLRTLALADAGALSIRKERLDFSALVSGIAEAYRDRMAQRAISLETHIQDGVMLRADPQRMRQLLQNLLENSSRYVQQGGHAELRLAQGEGEGEAELLLRDDGPGLEAEQLAQIFERFYRAEGSRSRAGGGSGLGLSICRNIVEAHGGSIRAASSVTGGLEMTIRLPLGPE